MRASSSQAADAWRFTRASDERFTGSSSALRFGELDKDGDGTLSREEIMSLFSQPAVKACAGENDVHAFLWNTRYN